MSKKAQKLPAQRREPMSLRRALELLEERGSSQDPIFFRGEETDPTSLVYSASVYDLPDDAAKVRIKYWGRWHGRKIKLVKGTLRGMVGERKSVLS